MTTPPPAPPLTAEELAGLKRGWRWHTGFGDTDRITVQVTDLQKLIAAAEHLAEAERQLAGADAALRNERQAVDHARGQFQILCDAGVGGAHIGNAIKRTIRALDLVIQARADARDEGARV